MAPENRVLGHSVELAGTLHCTQCFAGGRFTPRNPRGRGGFPIRDCLNEHGQRRWIHPARESEGHREGNPNGELYSRGLPPHAAVIGTFRQ
jgi:hypothetical protein